MSILSKQSSQFLQAIQDEVSDLRKEITKLAKKSSRQIEDSNLAEKASDGWHTSRDYIRDHAGSVARTARQHPTTSISLGSLLVLAAIGYGIYSLTREEDQSEYVRESNAIDPQI